MYDKLKSDHFGIEMFVLVLVRLLVLLLKSDHFGIEIDTQRYGYE